jgi:phosphoribosylformimino-5-aminoimidazole carboxamide ribotide isomerase
VKVIPVIDLMHGQVVHARRGERGNYRPIESRLVKGSGLVDVAAALLDFFSFDTLYLADLDAIERRGNHFASIQKLAARYPQVELWLDTGAACTPALTRMRPVVGSESLTASLVFKPQSILSLDFDGDELRGAKDLLGFPQCWPSDVIVMCLKNVGSDLGPDISKITKVKELAGERRCYCAGGVRGVGDLRLLEELRVSGALVASALHEGKLSAADLSGACSASEP